MNLFTKYYTRPLIHKLAKSQEGEEVTFIRPFSTIGLSSRKQYDLINQAWSSEEKSTLSKQWFYAKMCAAEYERLGESSSKSRLNEAKKLVMYEKAFKPYMRKLFFVHDAKKSKYVKKVFNAFATIQHDTQHQSRIANWLLFEEHYDYLAGWHDLANDVFIFTEKEYAETFLKLMQQ